MKIPGAILILFFFCSCITQKIPESGIDNKTRIEYKAKLDGTKHGSYSETYEGRKVQEGEYRNGEQHGVWKFYYWRDRIEGSFKNGSKDGEWKYYIDGVLIHTANYKNNTLITGKDSQIYTVVERIPEMGYSSLTEYIRQNVRYPQSAIHAGIQGTVYIQFIIDPSGEVADIKVLRGEIDAPSLDEEAKRVISQLPRWFPGMQANRPVNVLFTIPIKFKIK